MIGAEYKSHHVIEDEQANFFIRKIVLSNFFLIFFQNQFIFCLTLLNFKSYLPVTYFNSTFIVIIFHHKFWKSSQLSADKSVFNPLTSDYPTLRYIRFLYYKNNRKGFYSLKMSKIEPYRIIGQEVVKGQIIALV